MPPTAVSSKKGAFAKPRLAHAAAVYPNAAAAAEAGAQAEAAYEFALARDAYLAAAHLATGAAALPAVAAYAVFQVERFGQCDEIAAWLDDPAFGPPDDSKALQLLQLWATVGHAAAAAAHPRSASLDPALARLGDPEAAKRHATRSQLAAQAAHAAAAQALQPATAALAGHDLATAHAELQRHRSQWGDQPLFASLHAKLQAQQRLASAATLRQGIAQALDSHNLTAALQAAQTLADLPGAPEADRRWLGHVTALIEARQLQAWVTTAQSGDVATALLALAQIVVARGPRVQVSFAATADPLHRAWLAVLEGYSCSGNQALTQRTPALHALLELRQRLAEHADPDVLQSCVAKLPADWRTGPSVKAASQRIAAHRAADQAVQAQAFVEAVQAMLDHGDLDDAAAALQAFAGEQAPTAPIKALRSDLLAARQSRTRTLQLQTEFEAALQRSAWFAARAACSELSHLLPQAELAALRVRLNTAAGPNLRGKMMPPGLQKLDPAKPFAAAVVDGRLVLMQGDIWLCVVLDTLGLQPFALPTEFAIEAVTTTRLAGVAGQLRAAAIAGNRLMSIGHAPPDPPEILGGLDLATVLGGDDRVLGTALDPAAPRWHLLSAHGQRPGATQLVRIDSATLEVTDRRRTQPNLLSICAVEQRVRTILATSHPAQRDHRRWALALLDDGGEPIATWTDQALGETIGHIARAIAWPDQDRIYASFTTIDPFDRQTIAAQPSLLVLAGDRVSFCSTDLRRRFFPMAQFTVDHAWTLDPRAGRLWFAALPKDDAAGDALLLGVNAKTLRADEPQPIAGATRILALMAVPDGAVAVCRMRAGHFALLRATWSAGSLQLTTHKLPL